MTHNITDLNAFLFAQLERLDVETLTPEQIGDEVKRAEAIVSIADQISKNHDTALKAAKLFAEHGAQVLPMLPMVGKPE